LSDIRTFLFQTTASLHHKVDNAFSLDRIVSRSGYSAMLLSHASVVPVVEAFVDATGHLGDLPQVDTRCRSGALRDDLAVLGLEMPASIDMSFLNSRAGVAGLMYVMEGSRLGATVIRRRLMQSGAAFPTSFLSHGEGSGLWPSFLRWLNSTQWSERELVDMRDNAIGLFEYYLKSAEAQFPPYGPIPRTHC
tara:strand:+ start:26536 stop:27111 length:576 start_codon:yes stop_codon:yes gene_type:complete